MIKALLRGASLLLVVVLALTGLLLTSNLYTFQRLSDEAPVARLTFDFVAPQTWDVTLRVGDQCPPRTYRLYGDQWRVDALFLKWKPWANLFGFDALYRLERLSGRYTRIEDENSRKHEAVELVEAPVVNLVALAERYQGRFSPVDTLYGSSAYLGIDPGMEYRLYRTQSGLFARQEERAFARVENGQLVIEIDKPCPGAADK